MYNTPLDELLKAAFLAGVEAGEENMRYNLVSYEYHPQAIPSTYEAEFEEWRTKLGTQ